MRAANGFANKLLQQAKIKLIQSKAKLKGIRSQPELRWGLASKNPIAAITTWDESHDGETGFF